MQVIHNTNEKVAICYTVRDEARLLPSAIRYHLAAGCVKVYVFLDGTTDDTAELIRSIDGVEIHQTSLPDTNAEIADWICEILPMWHDNMDVRKRINTWRAAQLANEVGIEWLACIDPDELIIPAINMSVDKHMMPILLDGIALDVDQILLRNLELVPSKAESENPFIDGTLFLNRFPATEILFRYTSALARRILRSPKMHAWYEHLFYKIRFFGAWPRLMHHPVTGVGIPTAYFLGYVNYKSIIRTKSSKNFNFNIHRWQFHLRKPKTIYRGNVLHYDLFDYNYMAQKFRQRSESIIIKVFYCRYMFATIARECSLSDIRRFFLENVVLDNERQLSKLSRKRIVSRITSVRDFFLRE